MRHLANGIYLENAYKAELEDLKARYGQRYKDLSQTTIDKEIYGNLCRGFCDICRSHSKPISYYAWKLIRDGWEEGDFKRMYVLCDSEACMTFMLFKELP